MPTLLDIAGIDIVNSKFDGQSLMPLFSGENDCLRNFVFAEYHPRSPAIQLYNQSVQSRKWRLTVYPEKPEWGELFDLGEDPFEHNNLFSEPEYTHTIRELKHTISKYFPSRPKVNSERIAKW
jgi:arylsulfatase A-like enzyme